MSKARDVIAQALYAHHPFEEVGESLDGFPISPGGSLSWRQLGESAAEFPGSDYAEHFAGILSDASLILTVMAAAGLRVVPVEPDEGTVTRMSLAIGHALSTDPAGAVYLLGRASRAAYAAIVAGDGND